MRCVASPKSLGSAKEWPMIVHDDNQFERLPDPLVHLIFHYLTPWELLTVAEVSSAFYQLSRSDLSWVHHKERVLSAMPDFAHFFNRKIAHGGFVNRAKKLRDQSAPEPAQKRSKQQAKPNGIWRVFVERLLICKEFVDTTPLQLRQVKKSGLRVFAAAMRLNIPFYRSSIAETAFVKEDYGYGAMKGVRFSIQSGADTTFCMWFYLPKRIDAKSNYVIFDFGEDWTTTNAMYFSPYLFEPFIKFLHGDNVSDVDKSFGLRNDPEIHPKALGAKHYLDKTYNYWSTN